jgi:tetraacyldisaccharide 4'-kinase
MRREPPGWWYERPLPLAAWGLYPVSAAYGAIVQSRFASASPYRSTLPVVCIGNFTMGGAGKTPTALKVAALLRGAGYEPAFLSRGYGGRERGPHLVDPASDDAALVGDEPLLLAASGSTAVSRTRREGARLLERKGAGAIIMDDGFQNPSIHKDFSLIVVDAAAGLGNGLVFPLGPLRAPFGFQAPMADAILLLGANRRAAMASLLEELAKSCCNPPMFEAEITPAVTDEMRGRPFLAFCGIGRPSKFFETLQGAGIELAATRAFPDHHAYTEDDAVSLLCEAGAKGYGLITTEKDLARLRHHAGAQGELYKSALALPVTLVFAGQDEARFMQALLPRLAR